MRVRIGADQTHGLEHRVRYVVAEPAHLSGVVDRVREVLIDERSLPLARPVQSGVIVRGPGRQSLKNDLARFPSGLLSCPPVGSDHPRRLLRVRQRPDAVGQTSGDLGRLWPEGGHIDGRAAIQVEV